MEKMKQIEDADKCKINEEENVMEIDECDENSSKRKVTHAKENKVEYFKPQDPPHVIGMSDNRNQCVQWIKNMKVNNTKMERRVRKTRRSK